MLYLLGHALQSAQPYDALTILKRSINFANMIKTVKKYNIINGQVCIHHHSTLFNGLENFTNSDSA